MLLFGNLPLLFRNCNMRNANMQLYNHGVCITPFLMNNNIPMQGKPFVCRKTSRIISWYIFQRFVCPSSRNLEHILLSRVILSDTQVSDNKKSSEPLIFQQFEAFNFRA